MAADPELDESIPIQVKAELEPGERLLWVARPSARLESLTGGFARALIVAAILLIPSVVSWSQIVEDPLQPIGGLLFLGLGLGVVEFFLIFFMVLSRIARRQRLKRLARTRYALTDRRAILWTPESSAGAFKVISHLRGCVSGVHRVEYPDGSGDVLFRVKGEGLPFDEEHWGFAGFRQIADVRRVEALVRRTLVVADAD